MADDNDLIDAGDKDKGSGQSTRKKRVYFSPECDIYLLKIVLHLQPFAAPFGQIIPAWASVANSLKEAPVAMDVDHKRCKARVKTLLDAFQRGDEEYLNRVGTHREIQDKEKLLRKLAQKMEQHSNQSEASRSSSPMPDKNKKKINPVATPSMNSASNASRKRKLELESRPSLTESFGNASPMANIPVSNPMNHEMHEAEMEERRALREIKLQKFEFEKKKFEYHVQQLEMKRTERLAAQQQEHEKFLQLMNKLDKLLAVLSQGGFSWKP